MPAERYARMFLIQTLIHLWGRPYDEDDDSAKSQDLDDDGYPWRSPLHSEKRQGERAKRTISRLLFEGKWRGAGRPRDRVKAVVEDREIWRERERLLSRLQRFWKESELQKRRFKAPLVGVIQKYLSIPEREAKSRATRMLGRKSARCAHIADELVALKYNLSVSQIKKLLSRERQRRCLV